MELKIQDLVIHSLNNEGVIRLFDGVIRLFAGVALGNK